MMKIKTANQRIRVSKLLPQTPSSYSKIKPAPNGPERNNSDSGTSDAPRGSPIQFKNSKTHTNLPESGKSAIQMAQLGNGHGK